VRLGGALRLVRGGIHLGRTVVGHLVGGHLVGPLGAVARLIGVGVGLGGVVGSLGVVAGLVGLSRPLLGGDGGAAFGGDPDLLAGLLVDDPLALGPLLAGVGLLVGQLRL